MFFSARSGFKRLWPSQCQRQTLLNTLQPWNGNQYLYQSCPSKHTQECNSPSCEYSLRDSFGALTDCPSPDFLSLKGPSPWTGWCGPGSPCSQGRAFILCSHWRMEEEKDGTAQPMLSPSSFPVFLAPLAVLYIVLKWSREDIFSDFYLMSKV